MKKSSVRICKECLAYLPDDVSFCPECGELVDEGRRGLSDIRLGENFGSVCLMLFALGFGGGGAFCILETGGDFLFNKGLLNPIELVCGFGLQFVGAGFLFVFFQTLFYE